MKTTIRVAAVLAAAALSLPAMTGASVVISSSSFENSEDAAFTANATFTVTDAPVPVGTWSLQTGSAQIKAGGAANQGVQYVELSNRAQLDRDLSGPVTAHPSQVYFVEGYFNGAGSQQKLQDTAYPANPKASAIVHFSRESGIQLLNGDKNSGAGAVVTTDVALAAGTWHKITIGLNLADRSWDCFVDGNRKNSAPLGFRDNVTSLNGFLNLAETASGFDGFRVVKPVVGDANGDTQVDTADVVRLVEWDLGGAADPILNYNADVDQNGTVGAADYMELSNQILGFPS